MKFMQLILTFSLLLSCQWASSQNDMLLLKESGKVVIGDTSQISTPGDYFLYVQNGILTERVKVALSDSLEWRDGAFDHTPTLEQVSESIEKNSHLYSMPSAATLVEEGYELQVMDAKLLEQIEWLWQHVMKLKEENDELKNILESKK